VTSDWSYTDALILQLGPATDIVAGRLEERSLKADERKS